MLQAEISDILEQSRVLVATGQQRRLSSTYPRLRVIRGASDIGMVTDVITGARLCLHCIARKTGVPLEQVNLMLTTIVRTLRLGVGPHRCDACLQQKTTFSVTRDGHP